MHRRLAASRFLLITTLAALATSLVGTVPAQARPGSSAERQVISRDPQRDALGGRTYRHVNVRSLPAAKGTRSTYRPGPRQPLAGRAPAAPETQGAVAPAPVQTTSNGDPAILEKNSFEGVKHNTSEATHFEPSDPWVAAGPDHVFQAVNTLFRITDRAGHDPLDVEMFDFFGLGDFYDPDLNEVAYFDPHVFYDRLHNRWIAIEASFDCDPRPSNDNVDVGVGFTDIAISDGPDPTQGWGIISIPFIDSYPDYPGIGTSTDKVVVSANVFALEAGGAMGCQGTSFVTGEMDAMAWSQLIGTGDVTFDRFPIAGAHYSWRPALQTPATSATVFAVAERGDEGVSYARITGDPASAAGSTLTGPMNLTAAGTIAPFAQPPDPRQPGPDTIANAVDGRPTDAIWKDNRLAFVSTYPCDPNGGVAETRDCVRVAELSTSAPASPTRIQDFLVAEQTADLFTGGIGYALNDDLHIVWSRSSLDRYPTTYGGYQSETADVNTISQRALFRDGTGPYPGERWGDYLGVAQDPQVPNAVWQAAQYSTGSTTYWATEVTQLQSDGSTYVPIDPVRVLDTRPGAGIGLSGAFTHGVARSWMVGGVGAIPLNATAVTGNLTVVNQTGAGFVSVTPTPNNNPTSSTINFPLGDTRANNVTIPVNTNGKISAVYRSSPGKTAHLIFDVTGYFRFGSGDAAYKTITPVRALDSRNGTGLSGAFQKSVPRKLSIGPAHVPPEAVAITGNLTVVGQTGAGFLAITPNSQSAPTTSNLNFPVGEVRANGFVARLNNDDDVWIVYKSSASGARSAHVLLDVTGYFLDDPSGLQYFPLTPGRIMDSRGAPLSRLTGFFNTASPRKLVAADHWGVPAGAGAITGNLTVVGQTAAGFVSVTLTSQANPTTSNLNFPVGDVRANGITVPIAAGSDAWLVYKAISSGQRTHLILDVTGYFK